MGILKPDDTSDLEFAASERITQQFKDYTTKQNVLLKIDQKSYNTIKPQVKKEKDLLLASFNTKCAWENIQQKEASNWLIIFPLDCLCYTLSTRI